MHQYLFTDETNNDKNNISKCSYHVPDIVLLGLPFYCSLFLKNPVLLLPQFSEISDQV